MSDLRFGDIVSMDYQPSLRIMLLSRDWSPGKLREVWVGIVLADDPSSHHAWPQGHLTTIAPEGAGVIFIGRAEDL